MKSGRVDTLRARPRRAARALPGGLCAALLLAMPGVPGPRAAVQLVADGAGEVIAGAGQSLGSIDEVRFNVPGSSVGSGVPVAGLENGVRPSTLLYAGARTTAGAPRTVIWSVDSSVPLICVTPATCGATTVPMTRFRWDVITGSDVNSGLFDGTPNQVLATFSASRVLFVRKTFWYANDEIVPAGTYRGRVVYTVSMP